MQAIDALLFDQSDEFRAAVFELCRQLDWPDDEPGFLIAIAANQLQALLKRYPQQLTEAMKLATAEASGEWQSIQAALAMSAAQCRQTAEQIDGRVLDAQRVIEAQLTKVEALLDSQCENVQRSIQGELEDVVEVCERERKEMAAQAQALAEEQKAVIADYTKELIVEGVVASRQQAGAQVNEIVRVVRRKHYLEAGFYACGGAALLMSTSWLIGWYSCGLSENSATWGDIERWNGDQLQACIEVQKTTCNFHIQVPEQPLEEKSLEKISRSRYAREEGYRKKRRGQKGQSAKGYSRVHEAAHTTRKPTSWFP